MPGSSEVCCGFSIAPMSNTKYRAIEVDTGEILEIESTLVSRSSHVKYYIIDFRTDLNCLKSADQDILKTVFG